MRSAFRTLLLVTLFVSLAFTQTANPSVTVDGIEVLYSQPSNGTRLVVAQIVVTNHGAAISGLHGVVTSRSPDLVIAAGEVSFAAIAEGARAASQNTFAFRQNSTAPPNLSNLSVRFDSPAREAPSALAGLNQAVAPGKRVTLSGAGSTNPSGKLLSYLWYLASKPAGSRAVLGNPSNVTADFTPDVAGQYLAQLVVFDSEAASPVSTVTIAASAAAPPNAKIEAKPSAQPGSTVTLSGAASSDPNGFPLTYAWTLLSAPQGSAATLSSATSLSPSFVADAAGDYVVQLIVANGHATSAPALFTVSSPVSAPKADAGANQKIEAGRIAHLNGSGSTDPQGQPLIYQWSLVAVPVGSTASLSDATSATPTFVPDRAGAYAAQLVVHNGTLASNPATVIFDTETIPPSASPGPNQLISPGTIVQLDGSGSTNVNGTPIAFQWSLASVPQGSAAALSSTTAVRPTFTADLPGTYVAQLIVSDGTLSSAPAQAVIGTVAIPPIANAGPNQRVATGSMVTLNGSASTDPNGLPLSYSWTLLFVPQGSDATLSGANTAAPTFTVDLAGNYVAQLIVSDTDYSSTPSTVLITTGDLPPVANAGSTASVPTGTIVTLNGSGSSDPQGLSLTYNWSFLVIPSQSAAVLANPASVNPTFTADQPGIYLAQLIVNDGVQNSRPATVVVNGLFPAAVSVSLENPSLITYSSTAGDIHISNPATNSGGAGCGGQVIQISLDNASLGVLSTPTASPATSVCIPLGLQDAPFTLTAGGNTGYTTVSGFAPNFQAGSASFSVNPRAVAMSFDTTTVGQGRVANGTLTLANPAPQGGATINLSSSVPLIASVATPSVGIAQGATTATFQVNALSPGQAVISAAAAVAGYTAVTQTITVLSPALTITIPHNLAVGPGQKLPFPVSIGAAATSAVTIHLAVTGGPGSVTFSPANATIPAGATSPVTQPRITGAVLGGLTVTASAGGYAPDIETESVSVTLTLSPTSVNVSTVNKASLTLSASEKAPAGGLVVTLTLSDNTVASVPATVTIPAGTSSVKFYVTGVAGGLATLTAGGTGFVPATASIQVTQAPSMSFSAYPYGCPTSIGMNSINSGAAAGWPCYPVLGAPAPAGGETVTVTSSDPRLLTLTTDSTTTGGKSVTLNYLGGSTTPSSGSLYLAALAASGSVTVTASAPGYSPATLTVTLQPSGFIVNGGVQTTTFSGPSNVTVTFVPLDPVSLQPPCSYPYLYSCQSTLRPGSSPVTVRLANDNARAGALAATSVTIAPGTYSANTTYTPAKVGTSNISIAKTPTGYSQPSSGTTTQFTVVAPGMSFSAYPYLCPTSIGMNSINSGAVAGWPCYPVLGAPAPAGGETVTVTSSNPKLLTLTKDASSTGGKSVTFSYAGGSTTPSSGSLYLAALAASGSVTVTASAPGYSPATLTVTLQPSGFIINGGAQTTTFSGPSNVTVTFVPLDPVSLQPPCPIPYYSYCYTTLRPGVSPVTVRLADSNTRVGVLGATSVTISPGSSSASTTYTPVKVGTSNISIAKAPAGYSQPSSGTTTQFTVVAPDMSFSAYPYICPTSIGMNSINTGVVAGWPCYPVLGAPAPSNGEAVTITSSNPNLVTLTLNPATTGARSVTLNYSAGSTTPSNGSLYLAALASSGTVTITASAPGFNTATFTVTLQPSGFIVNGGAQTTTFSGPSNVTVTFVPLDPVSLQPPCAIPYYTYCYTTLRPGAAPVTINLANDNTGAGTLGANSVAITAGSGSANTTYTPSAPGTSNISIAKAPAGYSQPSSGTTTQFTVVAPDMSFSAYPYVCPTSIGMNSINSGVVAGWPCYPVLGAPAPSNGEAVTITSSNPNLVTLTLNPATTGSRSVTLNYSAGSTTPSNGSLYLAALASSGTVTITASAPGFNTATFTVTLQPSGFIVNGGAQTTTFSGPSNVTVTFVPLDPVSLQPPCAIPYYTYCYTTLRPGAAPVTVNLSNDNNAAGTLANNSVVIAPGNSSATTTYNPIAAGISNISIAATPGGYAKPFSGTSTQFTVVAPDMSFSAYPYVCPTSIGMNSVNSGAVAGWPCYPVLGAPAPSNGEAVTITSSNPNLVTLTLNPATTGAGSVTLNYSAGNTTPSNGSLYLAAMASSGTVTITASAPGFNTSTLTVTLQPTGFIVNGGAQTTTFSGPSNVAVTFVPLDPVSLQPPCASPYYPGCYITLRPGAAPVTVNLSNDNSAAGTLTSSSVAIAPGSWGATTTYNPIAAGTSNISIATPTGYTKPFTGTSTQFVVTAPNIGVVPATVGKNMMTTTYGEIAAGAPSNNYVVTVSVGDPTQLLLSATGTDLGTSSLTFYLNQGQTQTPQFWVFGLGNPGASTVNITTPSLSGSGVIAIDPSGFVFQNQNFTTTVGDAPTTLHIAPAALDPMYLLPVAIQQLRPGMTDTQVTVMLTDQPSQGPGNPSQVGQITVNPVVFNGADNPNLQITSFQPIGVGQTLLQLTSPGFSTSGSQVTATVAP